MAQLPVPQPKPNLPLVGSDLRPSLPWQQYLLKLDIVVRGLVSLFSIQGQFPPAISLIAVAVPTNANAATAGVAVGQLYTDTANPANVYIRTA